MPTTDVRRLRAKGFTLMEMLVVVAIIAVLVAIAIPVFSGQLASARKATDESNIRSAKSIAAAAQISNSITVDGTEMTITQAHSKALSPNGFYFLYVAKDGTITTDPSRAYVIQETFKYLGSDSDEDQFGKGEKLEIWFKEAAHSGVYVLTVVSG